ncbi:craniofacial development protein 1 [Moniliophthora roreri MCA 2997]|uniref:SWR1-complex protein 5 n=1 Tax=Moniliophthora roreri (strain MCA 2997) TaxID=1381753 RepID=V2YXF2_MONRO|nr:craniofacial development protein 1 [Moniliophthora roreri MCA 2997]
MPSSDSEDDGNYIPPANDPESSSSEDDEPDAKRARVTSPKPSEEDEAAKKLARETAWKNFKESVEGGNSTSEQNDQPKKTVKVEKRHLFAGEQVVEVVEVPEDSPDAKKWPRWVPPEKQPQTTAESSDTHVPQESPVPSSLSKPPLKRPGPRKSKTNLSTLPSGSSSKPKKMTMLEKSAMDWRSHVSSEQDSGLSDELTANRRGGGYLEKVEFLERVNERKEDVLEQNKGAKRRRG